MNNPHVVSLEYRIVHNLTVTGDSPAPLHLIVETRLKTAHFQGFH